jgi:hypothetical protein
VVEDLDGGDTGPSRALILRATSIVLVLATAIGWAALQSPALRGPYARPDPAGGVTFAERASTERSVLENWQPVTVSSPVSCTQIQQLRTGYGIVGDHAVTLVRPFPVPPPDVQTQTVITSSGPLLMWRTCHPETTTALWRFAP